MYGQNIRLFRKQKGMNQHELGAAMDVSAVSVSKWEREQTQPDIETLQAKAKSTLTAMNAPMRALLEESSDPRTFMIIQRYYVKGLTDQAIGREMNLTGARVNQIRLGYVRSLTNQAS